MFCVLSELQHLKEELQKREEEEEEKENRAVEEERKVPLVEEPKSQRLQERRGRQQNEEEEGGRRRRKSREFEEKDVEKLQRPKEDRETRLQVSCCCDESDSQHSLKKYKISHKCSQFL